MLLQMCSLLSMKQGGSRHLTINMVDKRMYGMQLPVTKTNELESVQHGSTGSEA